MAVGEEEVVVVLRAVGIVSLGKLYGQARDVVVGLYNTIEVICLVL